MKKNQPDNHKVSIQGKKITSWKGVKFLNKRDRNKLPTINAKVSSICNKQRHPVKPKMHYHAFKEKKENIFDVLLSFLKLGQGADDTKPSRKQP